VRRAPLVAIIGSVVLIAFGISVISGAQDCVLLVYGGPVQPEEPRTSCDPPWAPSPEVTISPEELPAVTADPMASPPPVPYEGEPAAEPEIHSSPSSVPASHSPGPSESAQAG
jgi:hypothetical protein